jgi:hypothetical protein
MAYTITEFPNKTIDLETNIGYDAESHEFKSWNEVNAFIDELRAMAQKVWGPDYSDPAYDI